MWRTELTFTFTHPSLRKTLETFEELVDYAESLGYVWDPGTKQTWSVSITSEKAKPG